MSKRRNLHILVLLCVLGIVAILAQSRMRPEPGAVPPPRISRTLAPWDSTNWLAATLTVSGERRREDAETAYLESVMVWPSGTRAEVRVDRDWSIEGVRLGMTRKAIETSCKGYEVTGKRRYFLVLDSARPDVRYLWGTLDERERVAWIEGPGLQLDSRVVVEAGNSGKAVEGALGKPSSAEGPGEVAWLLGTGETLWTYEYRSSLLELTFRENALQRIRLRDKGAPGRPAF